MENPVTCHLITQHTPPYAPDHDYLTARIAAQRRLLECLERGYAKAR
jgi:hypothetical protein